MDDSNLSKLLQQCKANDVDVKVDALTKLQAEFEAGIEIPEPDIVIQTLKTCLRTSNQHLSTATLSALPPLLPLLLSHGPSRPAVGPASASASTSSAGSSSVDTPTLRQVLLAFLPAGGIIDRLGEARERPREKARESLVLIGGFAFRSGGGSVMGRSKDGKGSETPIQMFERFVKEIGLGSKVWRVREQSILTLVNIRRAHHLFPIRSYSPLLVEALEDSDSTVRETARVSVVELFTGPGVTDAARADLKKEMTKKGTRKGIVDGVLAKIVGGSSTPASEGSENGDAPSGKKEYIPPSLALQGGRPTASENGAGPSGMSRSVSHGNVRDGSRPASRAGARTNVTSPPPVPSESGTDVQPYYVTSSRDLENEFADMFKPFEGKETEHNWAARERAIIRVRGMLKGDVHVRYTETFLAHLKQIADASLKTLASLRTIVSTNTCALYNELAVALGPAMDPICETLYINLLRMANFTKKIAASSSQATVDIIITNTSATARTLLPLLWNTLQDKTPQARQYVVDHLKLYVELHATRAKSNIESTGMLDTLDKSVRKAIGDANAGVRQSARSLFWAYHGVWPERGRVILEAQDNMLRKQLEKACPNPDALAAIPVVAPTTKKSSVAAAIAASRAKAKAIANAPPSLRHQATSTARAAVVTPPRRPSSPSVSSKSPGTERAASPLSRSTGSPPSSPRSRLVSNPAPVRVTPPVRVVSASHSRSSSNDSSNSASRRTGSPLMAGSSSPPRGSVLRRAMQTALPSSPPSTTVTPPSPVSPRQTASRTTVPAAARSSVAIPPMGHYGEESLLTAVAIPLPEDSDSDMELDESVNLISFSTPYEKYPPPARSTTNSRTNSFSPRSTGSKPGLSNSLSTSSPPAGVPQPIVEDVLRARAEQAESAAERLLELVEPEDETVQQAPLHSSLLLGNGSSTLKAKGPVSPARPFSSTVRPPVTPVNKNNSIWKQVASFKDSPAYNGSGSSLMTDVLKPLAPKNDSAWWRKRMALLNQKKMFRDSDASHYASELKRYIDALDDGSADVAMLKNMALFCASHPTVDPISPLSSSLSMPASPSPFISASSSLQSLKPDVWSESRGFERLWSGLKKFVVPERDEDELAYALIVLWEMLEYQSLRMEDRETDVFAMLLRSRYSSKQQVLDATNVIRDALTTRVEAVYGLMTMHAILLAFQTEPPPAFSSAEVKASIYAYGLIALGKFILRLPAEILEEELPRLKATLTSALNDASSLVVRESAAAVIIAAQLVLRDETHLFMLLEGLPDEKKNLLTYLFDKHGVRGADGPASIERLEREMRRLDGRMSTPPRPSAA
ncbi:hypothetical protein DENSPDRAFT_862277 [Dentipellis sp. KUC8613]|nr:hypothetical protein DENSPDRAFT_862277 [Dentipellis sp. KUC8613]